MAIVLDKVLNLIVLDEKAPKTMLNTEEAYHEEYDEGSVIGRGKFSVVKQVQCRRTGGKFAAKRMKVHRNDLQEMVHHEINILSGLCHDHILRLVGAYHISSSREVCIVTELLEGGELFEKVLSEDNLLTERECATFMKQICQGVSYLHEKSIVHLDLKPENVIVLNNTSDHVKIVDFGLAKHITDSNSIKVLQGTAEFMSPEVVNYDIISLETDIWSLGVIAYVLLSGLSPFLGESDAETYSNVTHAQIDFDCEEFDHISDNAKSFILQTVVKDQKKRMTATECLNHPWLTDIENIEESAIIKKDNLKRFVARRRWIKGGVAIRLMTRLAAGQIESSPPSPPPSIGSKIILNSGVLACDKE